MFNKIINASLQRYPNNMAYQYHKQYRLPGFDYSSNNSYFITIATKDRKHHFGEITNSEMFYTDIGFFAENLLKNANKKLDHLKIDEFVIMPNHLHFIATIYREDHDFQIPKLGLVPLVPKSISSFVNRFKGRLKRWCNDNDLEYFEWQARFRDRVIRNENEYYTIKTAILNNIKNWESNTESALPL